MNFNAFTFYISPIIITIISMVFGMILLRKHIFILVLPWFMWGFFLCFTFSLYWAITADIEYNIWCFSILHNDSFIPVSMLWAIISALTLLICAMVSLFIIAIVRGEYIEFSKKYIRIYIFTTLIPVIFYLLLWFHIKVISPNKIMCISFIILELANIVIFLAKAKHKKDVKTQGSFYIKLGMTIFLLSILIINRNEIAYMWYLSNGLLYYLWYTVHEVKRSKEEEYPYKSILIKSSIKNLFLEYISIICVIISCIIISIVEQLY